MRPLTSLVAFPAIWAVAAIAPNLAWAQPSGGFGGHMWGGGWGMFFGPLIWILIIVGIVLLVGYVVRGQGGEGGQGTRFLTRNTPLDILKERYARGEIDKKEFQEKKRVLEE